MTCYQKLQYQVRRSNYSLLDDEKIHPAQNIKTENLAEFDFVRNYFNHSDWIAQPATFRLNGTRYTPDFYDSKTNTFIEVSATRQAYSFNKHKYDLFRKLYPKLNFEIRKPNGELLEEDRPIYPQLIAKEAL